MTYTAKTYAEAKQIAKSLRDIYAGTDWIVSIVAPLYDGDAYHVTVGA